MMCAHNRIYYGPMVVFVRLYITLPHYHDYADVSEDNELLKYMSVTFCRVCVKSILSIIFHAIYRAVFNQFTHFSYKDKVWDEITYPSPNFNDKTVEFWE